MEEETNVTKKKFNPMIAVVLVVVVLLGAMFLLSMNKKPTESMTKIVEPTQAMTAQPTTAKATGEVTGEPTAMSAEVKEFKVEMGPFYFKPNQIKVKKGEKVKITFTNAGGIHDFRIDELNVQTNKINTGEIGSVEFTADKAGTFEFYCSVGNHRQMGMKGVLTVE